MMKKYIIIIVLLLHKMVFSQTYKFDALVSIHENNKPYKGKRLVLINSENNNYYGLNFKQPERLSIIDEKNKVSHSYTYSFSEDKKLTLNYISSVYFAEISQKDSEKYSYSEIRMVNENSYEIIIHSKNRKKNKRILFTLEDAQQTISYLPNIEGEYMKEIFSLLKNKISDSKNFIIKKVEIYTNAKKPKSINTVKSVIPLKLELSVNKRNIVFKEEKAALIPLKTN